MIAQRDTDTGLFPAWAWPGGYPIIYITADNSTLCPDCANRKNGSLARLPMDVQPEDEFPDDKQWTIIGMDVYYEGPPLYCEHCNADINSAYGDPEQKEQSHDPLQS